MGDERPEMWVRRVAVRIAIRQIRRETRRRGRERVVDRPVADLEPDVDLASAIATLAPMQRAAVVLFYFDDLPVAEVARLLVVSESTVKQHLYRARPDRRSFCTKR